MIAPNLPPYPASAGPQTANRLRTQRDRYLAAAGALRDELESAETEFSAAFDRVDAQQKTRNRIAQLAQQNRRR